MKYYKTREMTREEADRQLLALYCSTGSGKLMERPLVALFSAGVVVVLLVWLLS